MQIGGFLLLTINIVMMNIVSFNLWVLIWLLTGERLLGVIILHANGIVLVWHILAIARL
ncbi:hypothetical protein LSPH24S_02147 [Lysinibacillus sphaericus]